jgi:hypothetical protein
LTATEGTPPNHVIFSEGRRGLLKPMLMPGILDRDIEATKSFGRQAYIKFNRRIYYVDAASGERVSPADVGR